MTCSRLDEAFAYIESFTNLERSQQYTVRTYRLDRMHRLLDFFDHPERSYRIIHVAGSKGKGSTCTMVAYALQALGFKAGLYGSPHVSSYMERFTLAGTWFSDEMVLSAINGMFSHLEGFTFPEEQGYDRPTTFELLTLLALLLFKQSDCDYAVLETGLGGRLDATNVVEPVLTAVTPIELEHTNILGSTIAKIAAEKGGIIKKGVPVVTAPQHLDALTVLRNIAADRVSKFIYLPELLVHTSSHSTLREHHLCLMWSNDTVDDLHIRLLGSFQGENCATAIAMLEQLNLIPTAERREAALSGISRAVLPGRMEAIGRDPVIIIDGAHTSRSIDRVIDSFRELIPSGGAVIFGVVTGKDHTRMVESLLKAFDRLIISTPGTFKPSSPIELYTLCISTAQRMVAEGDLEAPPVILFEQQPARALKRSMELLYPGEGLLVTGSFYMAAEIRSICLQEVSYD